MAKKPTVTTLQSGFNSTEVLNQNFEALRDAFDNTLSLDGSTPNAMQGDLDLNGNNLIGATGLLINGTDYLADVESAKAAALVAQAAAELAENNAETSEVNAEASETAAGLSATASAASATASAASAVDATNNGAAQVTLAAAQVTLAETAKTAAELAETNAETAESNASTSATNAATFETNASASASTASTKAAEAATSATNAATSATEAETAKTGAETARDAALAALDSFDDRYLGVKPSDPTVDNDGDAILVGALYFNSNTDKLYIYDGAAWQITTSGAAAGDLISTNNLSDLTSAASARTNLGLGTGDSPTFAGLTTTGDVSFGDNDKVIFGAGSDLQIYHSGGNSYIEDVGTGDLVIKAGNLRMQNSDGTSQYILADDGGAVQLRYNGGTKLATTSTGIDVTGTVTADGLTVDGDVSLTYTDGIRLDTGTTGTDLIRTSFVSGVGDFLTISAAGSSSTNNISFRTASASNYEERMRIASNGDISFYEDTGTTPKFFWDASAESLGIGTSSPIYALQVGDAATTSQASFALASTTSGTCNIRFGDGVTGVTASRGRIEYDHSDDSLALWTSSSERMRIDSSGNVGIGKTNPATALDVNGTVSATTVDLGNWTVTESSGVLYFATGGVNKMKIDASGNLTTTGNITAFGTV